MVGIPKRIKDIYIHNRALIFNIAGSTAVKIIAVGIGVFTMPAYLNYFDNQAVAGVWLAMLSVLTLISVLDFGLGLGLRNLLTVALAQKDEAQIRRLISSSYAIILAVCAILWLVSMVLLVYIPWNSLLGVDEELVSQEALLYCVRLVISAVILQMALRLITSILYARQEAALVSILPVIANAALVLFVLLAPAMLDHAANLARVAWVYFFTSNVPYLIATVILFAKSMTRYRPSIQYVNVATGKAIFKLGGVFFYLSIISLMVWGTNDVLISSLFDSAMVVDYQVYNKIYSFITMVINVLYIPLWSAVTKAFAEHNISWVMRLHRFLCLLAIVAFVGGVLLIPCMQFIVDIWLGAHSFYIEPYFCIPFILVVTLDAWNGANCTICNGIGWLKPQVIIGPLTLLLKVGGTILIQQTLQHWIAIPLANFISLIPIAIAQYVYIRRKFGKMIRGELHVEKAS